MSQQTANLEELVETLSKLTVLDMSKLKTLLEDKWGVKAAAAVTVAAGGGAAAAPAAAAEEATEFNVFIVSCPEDKKIAAIKAVREITGLGLKEAKEMVESCPKEVKHAASKADAEAAKKKLEEAGVKVEVKGA